MCMICRGKTLMPSGGSKCWNQEPLGNAAGFNIDIALNKNTGRPFMKKMEIFFIGKSPPSVRLPCP